MVSLRNNKLLSSPSVKQLNLAHSLGCKMRSHCFPGWSCGVCRDAWFESAVTPQPKVLGAGVCGSTFTPVTSASRSSDKSYGKTWNPHCLSPLSPWNSSGMSFHQRQREEKNRINTGMRKVLGRATALCGECLLSFSSAWGWISFQRPLGAVESAILLIHTEHLQSTKNI